MLDYKWLFVEGESFVVMVDWRFQDFQRIFSDRYKFEIEIESYFPQFFYPSKMFRPLILTLLLLSLFQHTHSQTQTGYVDLNTNSGQFSYINEASNIICYKQVFEREFINTPRITASLAEFKTENSGDFQLFVKIRQGEISKTDAKFSVFARKSVSLWSKAVFSYLATDNELILPGIAYLETQSLSGCSKSVSENFVVPFPHNIHSPEVAAYVSGFDVSFEEIQLSSFEVSIKIIDKNEESFMLEVSRESDIQIYSVSVAYVAVSKQDNSINKVEVNTITELLKDIPAESPYIFIQPHNLVLKHANMFMGFQNFNFQYESGAQNIKSLALTINEQYMVIGCLDSSILQHVKVSYFILKQMFNCQSNEIVYYDQIKKNLDCKKCDLTKNKIPNQDKDHCVCKDNFYLIDGFCYEKPERAIYSEIQNSFVCNDGFTMIFNKPSKKYQCEKPPMNKLYNSNEGKWECLDTYFEIDGECLKVPEGGYFDLKSKKIQCRNGKFLIEGQCVQTGSNEEYSFEKKQFVCKAGFFRVNSACVKPIENAFYDNQSKKFICHKNFYPAQEGKCEKIPALMKFNEKLQKLVCQENLYYVKSVGCELMPDGMRYVESEEKFQCVKGSYLVKGSCTKPKNNEQWSETQNKFICNKGTYRVSGQCLTPKKNSYFSEITQKFECDNEYFEVDGECKAAPENMQYQRTLKNFVCSREFYPNSEKKCIKLPENKIWLQKAQKLICAEGFYELTNSECKKPETHEIYVESKKKFICDEEKGYLKIRGLCNQLPKNSIYLEKEETFKCLQKYYEKEGTCKQCASNCLQCSSADICQNCRDGFRVEEGKCSEKCGDGIKFEAQCDDGNSYDGDGCSSKCQLEAGFICEGGSPQSKDVCSEEFALIESQTGGNIPEGPIDLKMVGMSHLYGKIVLNVKMSYVPIALLSNTIELQKIFRILTNSKIPLKVSSMYIDTSQYTFVVLYDFKKFEPIPEYLTRIEIAPEIKEKYYKEIKVNPLFIRINPALMAKRDSGDAHDIL